MIHQYKLGGYNIVLDVGSGSVHVVDDLVYDLIEAYETTGTETLCARLSEQYAPSGLTRADVEEALADVEALRADGKLFAPDIYEGAAARVKTKHTIKALCLHVAHTCNLTCDYCFAGAGRYHGPSAVMSLETAKRAIDFLVEHSGSHYNLEVDFFGGEPLLNWDVVKETVRYARSIEKAKGKNFRFTLTTNGVLIDDDVIAFSNLEMSNVVLSLDGRRDVHDRLRKTPDGRGSYDIVVPKFRRLVEARGGRDYYIRGTFTHDNTDFTNDILHMADLGFTELSMEPVVSNPDDSCALTEEDLPTLLRQYELLAEEMRRRNNTGGGFRFYHFMLDLEHGPCIYKRVAGCGSGTEYLAVTPEGDLYPCHQFVGDPAFLMGDLHSGVVKADVRAAFAACNAYSRPECRECWARFYCAGGCAANAYRSTGTVGGVYEYGCKLFKKRVECGIMLKVAEALDGQRDA